MFHFEKEMDIAITFYLRYKHIYDGTGSNVHYVFHSLTKISAEENLTAVLQTRGSIDHC